MINFSYTISPFLKKELDSLEAARRNILLTLVSPREENRLKWETVVQRIVAATKIQRKTLSEHEIALLLSSQGKKILSPEEDFAVNYKASLDYIKSNWTLNPETVEVQHLLKLHSYLAKSAPKVDQKEIKTMISFLQVNPEHPIIQAGISCIIYYHLLGKSDEAKLHAILLCSLFLYKNGFELRGLLNLEEYFFEHTKSLFDLVDASLAHKNISAFLDYFVLATITQAEKAAKKITDKKFDIIYPDSFFDLTERQKQILNLLDLPGHRVTNKTVQKSCKVSQITASRDLAKLASLGLILSFGKGRSVYYTKT